MLKRLCKAERCGTRASFGEKNENPSFCKKHKSPTMINLINDLCNTKHNLPLTIYYCFYNITNDKLEILEDESYPQELKQIVKYLI